MFFDIFVVINIKILKWFYIMFLFIVMQFYYKHKFILEIFNTI